MQLVDSAEKADFVLVDDFSAGEQAPCRSSTPIRTVALDADTAKPDVTVTLSADAAVPDYKIYVHSVRFSHRTRPPSSPRCGRPTSGAKPPAPSASSG